MKRILRFRSAVAVPAVLTVALAVPGHSQAQGPVKQPEVKVGPYRVVVDRITQNRGVVMEYQTTGQANPSLRVQRTVQVQVAVLGEEPGARDQLSTFQIKSVLVERNGRPVELPHYGGPLEAPNDPSLVRAYLYVPSLPATLKELRAIEGEIVSYTKTEMLDVEVPLEGAAPQTVEKDGVKVTVREWAQEGPAVRVVLWVEAQPSSLLLNTTTDGSYGVTLYNREGRATLVGAGNMLQVRPHQAELRMSYSSVQGQVAKVRLRLLHRVGPRKVYPFRIERVPIAVRPGRS